MKSLIVRKLKMEPVDVETPPLAEGKARIKVGFAGVGFADAMAVKGKYALAPKRPFSPGYEFFGRVETAPADSGLKTGDRVAGMLPSMGAYREYIDIDPVWAVRVPDEVGDAEAAMLPLNYLTAVALIERKAALVAGDTLFIQGAAGGVGTAVLEIARLKGITVYGTASMAKHGIVEKLGGIPLDHRDPGWMDALSRMLPSGADAVFDAMGSESIRRAWRFVAKGGVMVCYGFSKDIDAGKGELYKGLATLLVKKLFSPDRRIAVCGTPGIIRSDTEWYRRELSRVFELAAAKRVSPLLHRVYGWSEAAEAHRQLETGATRGKLLLAF